jgi:hypothetical protein
MFALSFLECVAAGKGTSAGWRWTGSGCWEGCRGAIVRM